MAGIKALRKLQIGAESTKGTAAAATALWRGMGTIQDARTVVMTEEDIGILGGTLRSYIPKLEATITMEETPVTFEQLPYILEAGVLKETPAQDGAGSGYIYDYDFPTTSANTIRTYTIEGGDNQQAEEMEYSFVQAFTLSGVAGEAWQVSADWIGRQVANTTFTGSIAVPTVEEMLFSKSKLYIDDTGGTIGSTQATSTFLAATLNINTGLRPVYTGDGNLYFTFDKNVGWTIEGTITFEHDSTATTEKTNWRNQTAQLIRILCQGKALGTAGTTYTYKSMIIDLPIKWTEFAPISDQDGNDIIEASFISRYSVADTLAPSIIVVNELSSLT